MGAIAGWARTGPWTRIWVAAFAGLVGGAGMFAVAGWSRTRDALPAFERFAPAADAGVAAGSPSADDAVVLGQIVRAAGANASLTIAGVPAALYRPDGSAVVTDVVASPVPAVGSVDRARLVAGRAADPARSDELTMNETAAADLHVHPGSTIDVGLFDAAQAGGSAQGAPEPRLGRIPMTVTGIVRYTADLVHQPDAQPGTDFATADERVSFSDGFWPAYGVRRVPIDFLGVAVKLPDGAAGFTRLATTTAEVSNGRFNASLGDNFIPNRSTLIRTIDLQAAALLVVGLLGALAGAVLLAQAMARTVAYRAVDHRILSGLGMTRRQIVAGEVLAVAPGAVGAMVVAAALTIGLSGMTPVGVAREAELHPGLEVNWTVVSVGGVAIGAFVVGVTALAAWVSGRARPQPVTRRSWLPSQLAAASAPPAVVAGADFALSRHDKASGAARTALAALGVGLTVVVAAAVVQASLSSLLQDPAARGWDWDAQVGLVTSPDSATTDALALDHDPDVAGYDGEFGGIYVPIDGHPTPVTVLDPHGVVARPVVLDGRAPTEADEIGLGPQTIARLHKHVGDIVTVSSPGGQDLQLRIAGTIVPLSAVDSLESFGNGATVPLAAAKRAASDEPLIPSAFLVSFRQGVDRGSALGHLEQLFPRTVLLAPSSVDVDTLRRVEWMAPALAGLVALLAIGTLAHMVVMNTRRHRNDIAVLRAIGFTKTQTACVVLVVASVLSVVMLMIGIPLGVVAGRFAWTIIVGGLGAVADPELPRSLLALVPTTIGIAVLIALLPAWRTTRRRTSTALRKE